MAKTAQFFKVTFEDIKHKWSKIYPAKTKESLIDALNEKELKRVNIVGVDWLGHHLVEIQPNEEGDNLKFVATINGEDVTINESDIGFDYLELQLYKQIKEFKKEYFKHI